MTKDGGELPIGSLVLVPSLKKSGTLIAISKNGKARVLVEGKEISCHKDMLRPACESTVKKVSKKRAVAPSKNSPFGAPPIVTVDLHGFRAEMVERACEDALNSTLLAHAESLEIVHGHGRGVVKKLVWEFFAKNRFVKQMRIHPMNSGVTQIFL